MHYLYEELDQYYNKDMSLLKRIACKRHIAKCPLCQKILERVKSDNELLQNASKSFANPSEEQP